MKLSCYAVSQRACGQTSSPIQKIQLELMNFLSDCHEQSSTHHVSCQQPKPMEGDTPTLALQGCIRTNTHHGRHKIPLSGDRQTKPQPVDTKNHRRMPINDVNNN